MISKISFSKLVRDEMRKLNWLLAVQILVFGLLIPFRVLMELAMRRPAVFCGTDTYQRYLQQQHRIGAFGKYDVYTDGGRYLCDQRILLCTFFAEA